MIKSAIILCGGKATRLGDLAKETPKILMEVREIEGMKYTLLDLQLEMLYDNGVRNVVLAAGHLSEKIEEYVEYIEYMQRDVDYFEDMTFKVSKEEEPLGTGGAFKKAFELVDDRCVVGLNGDVYCPDLDLREAVERVQRHHHAAAIVGAKYEVPYGVLDVSPATQVLRSFGEKKPVYINAGVYVLNAIFLADRLPVKGSIEHDFFSSHPSMLAFHKHDGPWFDIGTPESLEACREYISKAEG